MMLLPWERSGQQEYHASRLLSAATLLLTRVDEVNGSAGAVREYFAALDLPLFAHGSAVSLPPLEKAILPEPASSRARRLGGGDASLEPQGL